MPLRLDVKRQLVQRTDRVKGVDLHPTEPWLLANLYNGNIYLWNHSDQTLVKSFEVTELPVRCAKFVARKQWIICGADDMFIRVYNYNTMDKVKVFEAHTDYIRCIAVHPSMPYILTCSDDMLIKLWDWDKGWMCTQIFEGHSHYIMQVAFNPKDTNTFASASLDRTIKVWSVGQPTPNFTLEGHEKGVNCVDYFNGGDRPYLISGADDRMIKVWDYQTKACVQTLEGHSHNISSVCFHPELPVIITGSEDGTVKLWHNTTYRLENTLNYGMERVWAVGYQKGSNSIGIGYDEGVVMVKIGREEPVASMDTSGKIIWARHNEVQTVNVKSLGADYEIQDGERLPLAVKDLGSCDLYPQSLAHNPNGRFVVVCGDGEYIVYTALAWRNKSFGSAADFVWSPDSNDFAVREGGNKVKIFKNFVEKAAVKLDYTPEGLHGGALVGARTPEFVCFYDWADGRLVRRIDVAAKHVHWSENGELVAIVAEQSFYILRYNRDAVEAAFATGEGMDEDGCEEAFELLHEVQERVRTGLWVGDCFVYNNSAWRLNYCVGGEVTTLYHLDRPMYMLGYLAAQNRVYLIDREYNIVCYTLLLSIVELKTLVMRGEMDAAFGLMPTIPQDQLNNVAKFLESRGLAREALEVATEPDYKFELAVQLGDLETAQAIAEQLDTENKWKQLGELAMAAGKLELAQACLDKAGDLSGLLLMNASLGSTAGMAALAERAAAAGKQNVAFLALFLLGQVDACVELLSSSGRLPEAAFFARTYAPSRMDEVVQVWKKDLSLQNPKAAESLANPAEYPNLFPDLEDALKAEKFSAVQRSKGRPPATSYPSFEGATLADLIAEIRELGLEDTTPTADANGAAFAEEPQSYEVEEEVEVTEEEEEAAEQQPQQMEEDDTAALFSEPVLPPPPVQAAPPVPAPAAAVPPVVPAVAAAIAASQPAAPSSDVASDAFAADEFADVEGGEGVELDDDWGLDEDEEK